MKKISLLPLALMLILEIPVLATEQSPLPRALTAHHHWQGLLGNPLDIRDTKAVWEMLMAPIVVVKGHQKSQQLLYSEPDSKSTPVGDVTRLPGLACAGNTG